MAGLVCVKDGRFLRTKKICVSIEERMPTGRCRTCGYKKDAHDNPAEVIAGRACTHWEEVWVGYKLWICDLFECPTCGFQLAAGFPSRAISEHFMPDYAARVERHQPLARVDDCSGAKP